MDDELEDFFRDFCCQKNPEPPSLDSIVERQAYAFTGQSLSPVLRCFRVAGQNPAPLPLPEPTAPTTYDPSTDTVEDTVEAFRDKTPPIIECPVPTRSIKPEDLVVYNPPLKNGVLSEQELFVNLSRRLLQQGPFSFVDLPENLFEGEGVYALYYHGVLLIYAPIRSPGATCPIYLGKQAALNPSPNSTRHTVAQRLMEHYRSIQQTGLGLENFTFRFLLLPNIQAELAEKVLLKGWDPLWNKSLRGFGNQASREDARMGSASTSRWDVLHPGRVGVGKLARIREDVEERLGKAIPSHVIAYHAAMAAISGPGSENCPGQNLRPSPGSGRSPF